MTWIHIEVDHNNFVMSPKYVSFSTHTFICSICVRILWVKTSTHAEVMARYRSWPAVSQIWAFIVFPSTWMLLVANSTPMVLLLSRLNSLRVKRDRRLLFPTPESPINTTERRDIIFTINSSYQHRPHAAVQPGRHHPPQIHSQTTQERLNIDNSTVFPMHSLLLQAQKRPKLFCGE